MLASGAPRHDSYTKRTIRYAARGKLAVALAALDVVKKVIALVIVLLMIATVDFILFQATNDGTLLVPRTNNPDLRRLAIDEHHLDDSIIVQYVDYLAHTFTGGFYTSTTYQRGAHVQDFIWDFGANTLFLFGSISLLSMLLASVLVAVWRQRDASIAGKGILGISILAASSFPLAVPMAVLTIGIWMNAGLPIGGPHGIEFTSDDFLSYEGMADIVRHAIVPIISGVLITFGLFTLVFVSGMRRHLGLDAGKQPRVRRLDGFWNALDSEMPFPKFLIVWSMTSALAIDIPCNYKGFGLALWDALSLRDFSMVMALFFTISLMVAVSIFILDIAVAALRDDPKHKLPPETATIAATSLRAPRPFGQVLHGAWGICRKSPSWIIAALALIAIMAAAFAAPIISTVEDPNHVQNREPSDPGSNWFNPLPPSLTRSPYSGVMHPLGTDYSGQDIYSLSVYGTRHALATAAVISVVIITIGFLIGILSGLTRGVTGFVERSFGAIFSVGSSGLLAIPPVVLTVGVFVVLSLDYWGALLALCVVYSMWSWWPISKAARDRLTSSSGVELGDVAWHKVAAATLHVAKYGVIICVMTMMFVEFFGFGDPRVISWGGMIENAYERDVMVGGPWTWIVAPFIGVLLLISSLFVSLHTLEMAIECAGTKSDDAPTPAQ
jgi:ABC-type dipeptide/oligopeptide/nickel transport system permease component/ABC-type dipeptide/oligopeptide/nickel transport system permease subunit